MPVEDETRQSGLVRFAAGVYSLETVKKAAYRLSARCAFDFNVDGGGDILCRLQFPEALTTEHAVELERDFKNEVLDQDLRHLIAEETTPVRNAILAYAFSQTGLQGGE
jgi:His-Xaa-Ser system protein HxsD